MKRITFVIVLVLFSALNSQIFARDINWYAQHPEVVQKVIQDCPRKQPKDISCSQLQQVAMKLNDLIHLFVTDSQNYGQEILDLQQKIAQKEKIAVAKPIDEELKLSILKDKLDVQQRLNIVRWLASP